jgi:hypothetical protein
MTGPFYHTGCRCAHVLEIPEHALDAIAVSVTGEVACNVDLAISPWRHEFADRAIVQGLPTYQDKTERGP